MEIEPSYRRFLCVRCQQVVNLCSYCDHGNRYCLRDCSATARRESLQEAGQRYQKTEPGRAQHAVRQRRYRARLRSRVTHHPPPPEPPPATVSLPPFDRLVVSRVEPQQRRPWLAPREVNLETRLVPCDGCGRLCADFVRHNFLRQRRRVWLRRYARVGGEPWSSLKSRRGSCASTTSKNGPSEPSPGN